MIDLVGKSYPILDEENKLVGFKTIRKCRMVENVAGVVIELTEDESSGVIFLNYTKSLELMNNQDMLKNLKCLDKSGAV